LDTQLAQEWLSDREDGKLPDLIGIRLEEGNSATVDIIEVKTYSDSANAFAITTGRIAGHAVEQAAILEELVREMFGAAEKITTVSRREILREQVFEGLFQAELTPKEKMQYSDQLNELFAGQYKLSVNKNIAFVDFENAESSFREYKGIEEYANDSFFLTTIGSKEIQAILADEEFSVPVTATIATQEAAVCEEQRETATLPDAVTTSLVNTVQGIGCFADTIAQSTTLSVEVNKAFEEKCAKINKVFRDYGINAYPVTVDDVQEAARFTRFSVELKSGESVRSIEKYKVDIGRQLVYLFRDTRTASDQNL